MAEVNYTSQRINVGLVPVTQNTQLNLHSLCKHAFFLNTHTPTKTFTHLGTHAKIRLYVCVCVCTCTCAHGGDYQCYRILNTGSEEASEEQHSSLKDGESSPAAEGEKATKHTRTHTRASVAKVERVEQHIEQHLRTSVLRGRADSRSNKKAREREAEKNKAGR